MTQKGGITFVDTADPQRQAKRRARLAEERRRQAEMVEWYETMRQAENDAFLNRSRGGVLSDWNPFNSRY